MQVTPVQDRLPRFFAGLAVALLAVLSATDVWAATSPFGVAIPDSAPPPDDGPFRSFFLWVAAKQSEFYRALVEAIKALKESGAAAPTLIGLSFLYGLFHAAGPGHGKVVVSSYVLASNETARTGVLVSFAASLVQAVSAVVFIGLAAIVLNMTSIAITETTRYVEIGSYGLVAALGVFLVWKKILSPLVRRRSAPGLKLAMAPAGGPDHHHAYHAHDHDGHHHHHQDHTHGHDHHHHDHDHHDGHCCHITGADQAASISRSQTPLKDAIAAILAVGMRPCSGALIVLVFALSQGLFWAGIASAFAMAVGTGLVVSLLVVLSVTARDAALRVAGISDGLGGRVQAIIEGTAAIAVLLIGLTLLYAAFLQPAI